LLTWLSVGKLRCAMAACSSYRRWTMHNSPLIFFRQILLWLSAQVWGMAASSHKLKNRSSTPQEFHTWGENSSMRHCIRPSPSVLPHNIRGSRLVPR
jgi:hypothetical protein